MLTVDALHRSCIAPAFALIAPSPAPCSGMMDLKGAHEWVVTTKLGSSDVRPGTTPTVTRNCRMYAGEMAMSGFVLGAAFYGVFTVNRWTFSIFLFLQVWNTSRSSQSPATDTCPPVVSSKPCASLAFNVRIATDTDDAADDALLACVAHSAIVHMPRLCTVSGRRDVNVVKPSEAK